MHELPTTTGDPVLEEQIDRALEPYRAVLSPATLAVFRAFLADALTTHPVGARLLDRVRPRVAPLQSGDVPKHRLGVEPTREASSKRGLGKRGRGGT